MAYQTVLPVFAATLTDSPVLIGLVPAIVDAGWFLPQMFFAPLLERLPRRKPVVLTAGVIERLPYLLLALLAVWLTRQQGNIPIAIFLLLLVWKSLTGGFAGLAWQDFIAKVIPGWLRGRFIGISQFGGKLLGLAAASITGVILARLPYPQNYSLVFLLAFIFLSLSLVFFAFTIEKDGTPPPAHENIAVPYRDRIWGILKQDKNFSRYLFSRGLSYMGGMAYSFVAVYAIQRFRLGDSYAAIFTTILLGATTSALPVWGLLRDRIGSKATMAWSSLFLGMALAVLMLWQDLMGVYVAFALIGLCQPGNMIGDINMVMEFENGSRRPTYIGMARTLTAPLLLAAPVLGGLIIEAGGYIPMFLVSVIFGALGTGMLVFGVKDPRRRTQ
jgi:MFS family permease